MVSESGPEQRRGGLGGFIPLFMRGGVERPAGGDASGRAGVGDAAGAPDGGRGSGDGAPRRGSSAGWPACLGVCSVEAGGECGCRAGLILG